MFEIITDSFIEQYGRTKANLINKNPGKKSIIIFLSTLMFAVKALFWLMVFIACSIGVGFIVALIFMNIVPFVHAFMYSTTVAWPVAFLTLTVYGATTIAAITGIYAVKPKLQKWLDKDDF